MLVLLVLIVSILIFRALGLAGVPALASWPAAARDGLAVMLLLTASGHFLPMKEDLVRMTPPWVPWPRAMVFFTGVCEVAGAIGLVVPALQRAAGIALIVFFIAVLPANIHAARAKVTLRGRPPTPLWLRVPMQILFIGLAWWSTGAVSVHAQAREPMPLAHGNVSGEPHHHLKIENEYVRVYYVEVPPREKTQLHQHDHDYLFVTLGDSDVINAVRDKPEIHLLLRDGETHFTRGGFAHVARNLSDTPFRNITIELLKPQTAPQNQCEKVALDLPAKDCNKPDDFSKLPPDSPLRSLAKVMLRPRRMFATDQMRLTEISGSVQGSYTEGDSMAGRLLVVEDGSVVDIEMDGESPKLLRGGEVAWLDGQKKWKATTPGHREIRFLMIQFRVSEVNPAAAPRSDK